MKTINDQLAKILELSIETDERMATELAALQTWASKFMKDIDEQRHAVKMAVDTQADHMLGELKVFQSRIESSVSQLRGSQIEHQPEEEKETAITKLERMAKPQQTHFIRRNPNG